MEEFWIQLLAVLTLLTPTPSASDTPELIGAVGGSVTFHVPKTDPEGKAALWSFENEPIVTVLFEDPPQPIFLKEEYKTRFAVSEGGRALSVSQLRMEDAGTYSANIHGKISTFTLLVYRKLPDPRVPCEAKDCSGAPANIRMGIGIGIAVMMLVFFLLVLFCKSRGYRLVRTAKPASGSAEISSTIAKTGHQGYFQATTWPGPAPGMALDQHRPGVGWTISPPARITNQLGPVLGLASDQLGPGSRRALSVPAWITYQLEPVPGLASDQLGPVPGPASDQLRPELRLASDQLEPVPGLASDQLRPELRLASDQLGPVPGPASDRLGPVPGLASDQLRPVPGLASDQLGPVPGLASDQLGPVPGLASDQLGPLLAPASDRHRRQSRWSISEPAQITNQLRPVPGPASYHCRPAPGPAMNPYRPRAISERT